MESMQWYAFSAYNTERQYGWGCESNANRYLKYLNKNREINLYEKEILTDISVQKALETERTDGFDIKNALLELL